MRRFGERIRALRKARNMTIEEIAERSGIRKGYLSGIECLKVNPPSPRVVRALARALGADVRTLLLHAYVEKAPKEIRAELRRAVFDGTKRGD
jgi:transcriptional regulator with XRE-family HTH domain